MKKLLLLLTAVLFSMASAFAQDCDHSGTTGPLEWCLKDGTLTISGTGAMPNYYWDAPWYQYQESITSVVIENGVLTIGNYAFFACTAICSISIPDGIMIIGDRAFGSCSSLVLITIPSSVLMIGAEAFFNCTSLVLVTLSNGITSIENSAFSYCSALLSITIPNSVTTIGERVFTNCYKLTSINVESGNANYSAENGVLFNNDKTTLICCPAGKTGNYTVPNGVTTIGNAAFYYCKLISITLSNGVTTIGNSAFSSCYELTSITIPSSVITIGDWAFLECTNLASIDVESGNSAYASENGVLFDNNKTTLILCPPKKTGAYVIPNSVITIRQSAFSYCTSLNSISIPNGVTTIGEAAFYGCSSLSSISIPNGITIIEGNTFCSCTKLTSFIIPNSVTTIYYQAFCYCTSLTSITIPNNVTDISSTAFLYCENLISIDVENENNTFSSENGVLFNKDKTTLLRCPEGKTGAYVIPNGVKTIGDSSFEYCRKLTSITIPNSVTSIEYFAFGICENLTLIINLNVIPTEISPGAFNWINQGECTLRVPMASVSAYQNAEVWKEFKIVGGLLVNPVANNNGYGSTSGYGLYELNATATVTATAHAGYKFVNWTKDGVEVSTENPYSFTVTEDVELVANFEEGVGVVETHNCASLRVYPNPTTGVLNLIQETINNEQLTMNSVEVFDIYGRKVISDMRQSEIGKSEIGTSEIKINISHLPAGIYFVNVGNETVKVVKQ